MSNLLEPKAQTVKRINAYLADAQNVFIDSRSSVLDTQTNQMVFGSMPKDGGNLIIEENEYTSFLQQEPEAERYIRPFLGAEEFINNKKRYCLWLLNAEPQHLKKCPLIVARIQKVREHREGSSREATRKLAQTPSLFGEIRQPESGHYLLVPSTSSERRKYIPIGFMNSSDISSNANLLVPNATLYEFGVLTSQMHMAWMRTVCGRLEMRYRYSAQIVYNNFPWPDISEEQKAAIMQKAQAVLDARAQFPDSSLADLYDPNTMPPVLSKAHAALDSAVDKLYRKAPFPDDAARVAFLFELYGKRTVLGYIDTSLSDRIKTNNIIDYHILRYRDDYKIFVNNPHTGEHILKIITEVLAEFGMKPNTLKTNTYDNIILHAIKRIQKTLKRNLVKRDRSFINEKLLSAYISYPMYK